MSDAPLNVYDFDGTIYRGDSTADFYLYCLKRKPLLLCDLAVAGLYFAAYRIGLLSKTRAKERFYRFLTFLPDVDGMLEAFWQTHMDHIYPWYLAEKRTGDVIVSASPEFLLAPACRRLGVTLIGSLVDKRTGKAGGENCHGPEKVRRLYAYCPGCRIARFYSDTRIDAPLARLADAAFLIQRGRVTPYPKKWL